MTTHHNFHDVCRRLEQGSLRVAQKVGGEWTVDPTVKQAILDAFAAGKLTDMSQGGFSFFDKDTIPMRQFTASHQVRLVPGGSAVRSGAYLAPGVIMMPPSYVNIGAHVGAGTLIDSHVLVGSCAQIGERVHLSAGVQIGGVLEPVGAMPVIVEDDAFVGGNCGIYEGTVVGAGAVIATGVVIGRSTPIYDAVHGTWIGPNERQQVVVPAGAVVVAGSRPATHGPAREAGVHLYCPVIVKYRDAGTSAAVVLEGLLR